MMTSISVVSTIPKIVCETLAALGLQEEIPSWKIMDNKGKITVVLHWEKEHPPGHPPALAVGPGSVSGGGSGGVSRVTSRQSSTSSTIAQGGPRLLGVNTRGASQRSASSVTSTPCLSRDNSHTSHSSAAHQNTHSMHVQTSFDSSAGQGKRDTVRGDESSVNRGGVQGGVQESTVYRGGSSAAPLVTVINTDEVPGGPANKQVVSGGFLQSAGLHGCRAIISGAPSPRQLSRQGSSIESAVHTHTVECTGSQGARLHQPLSQHSRGSPTSAECDFHCCSLHGTTNNNHKTVATSPVQVSRTSQTRPELTVRTTKIFPSKKKII